jgi:hypothetical protein
LLHGLEVRRAIMTRHLLSDKKELIQTLGPVSRETLLYN